MDKDNVPMMFRAQLIGRGHLQKVPHKQQHPAYKWAKEWTAEYPKLKDKSDRPNSCARPSTYQATPPKFYGLVQTNCYQLDWRLIANSGQDDTIIRPVIGARGYPFFPGSSMKGAFRRACSTDIQRQKYCGSQSGDQSLKPGLLRFHGGYPIDTSWTEGLVDIVHPQENKQVKSQKGASAHAIISLKNVTFEFGISSLDPDRTDWQEVWEIWERALAAGLGSRTSTGYGHFKSKKGNDLLNIVGEAYLSGRGLYPLLLQKTQGSQTQPYEFRCNIFKAALRGHTLRLFGGLTNCFKAEYLTKLLWGGFRKKNNIQKPNWDNYRGGAIVGLLGIVFDGDIKTIAKNTTPIYKVENGKLTIYQIHSYNKINQKLLKKLIQNLLQFSMLFAGFGKSWRRADHDIFYPDETYDTQIGCHWKLDRNIFQIESLNDIRKFLEETELVFREWGTEQIQELGTEKATKWREAWHPYRQQDYSGVQVWGRIASCQKDSKAIRWFHKKYDRSNSIKHSELTGWIDKNKQPKSQVGRIWHRMYPIDSNRYIELLTIFPGSFTSQTSKSKTSKFLKFLELRSDFELIYGESNS